MFIWTISIKFDSEMQENESTALKEEVNELKEKLAIANEKIGLQQRQLDKISSVNKEYLESKESVQVVCNSLQNELKSLKKISREKLTDLNKEVLQKSTQCKEELDAAYKLEKQTEEHVKPLEDKLELEKTKQVKKKVNKLLESLKKKLRKAALCIVYCFVKLKSKSM